MMARIGWASAKLWTWEVVTGFDEDPTPEFLRKRFAEDFPKMSVSGFPLFWKMVAFNAGDGRRHRFLCASPQGDLSQMHRRCDRILPASIGIFGYADEWMRTNDGMENLRLAFLTENVLYILVFFEGRLCHWFEGLVSEMEVGERLARFDEFLRRDALFSRAERFEQMQVDESAMVLLNASERESWRRRAAKDPFWRFLDLDPIPGMKPRRKRFCLWASVAILVLVGALLGMDFTLLKKEVLEGGNGGLAREWPGKTLASRLFVRDEDGGMLKKESTLMGEAPPLTGVKGRRTKAHAKIPAARCPPPKFRIGGIVAHRLFWVQERGGAASEFYAVGSVVGPYRVEAIGSDRVTLKCGKRLYEVVNGRP